MFRHETSAASYPLAGSVAGTHSVRSLQLAHREDVRLLGALLYSLPQACLSKGNGCERDRGLSFLFANERKVAPSTHHQALAAILYLYKEVLNIQLPWLDPIGRPKERI